jgi:class 3 adenylate cyclase
MGLHSGEGRLGGDDYFGIDVHRAARISASGHGGQVLLSNATRALVESALPDGVELRDLGSIG